MNPKLIALLSLALSCNLAQGAESSFDGVRCDSKIESVLLGRVMQNTKVAAIEKKYKQLNLQLLWSDGLEADGDPWTLTSWMICEKEYLLVHRKNVVKDVLAAPQNLPHHKFELGTCQSQGKTIPGTAIFLAPTQNKAMPILFDRVWTIDESKLSFREIKGGKISCAK